MTTEPRDLVHPAFSERSQSGADDQIMVGQVIAAVRAAGARMLELFPSQPAYTTRDGVVAAIHANDVESLAVLRPRLSAIRPTAGWVDDELESGPLPAGEWWVADPIEGNINHVHGLPDWGVTATLVRDNLPVLTAVHMPLTGNTYHAVRGGGAYLDNVPIRPSGKTRLDGALVGTGQARPGESALTYERIGASATAMLNAALVIRVSVPATLQLIHVASGRMEAFWQFSQVRSGLLAGALLVAEAGGLVTDTRGRPWTLDSEDFLAATPGLHDEAVATLSKIT